MGKRKIIIELLKEIKPIVADDIWPTSIFIPGKEGEAYRRLNISDISRREDYIVVTVGKYLFKRRYHIKSDEI